MYLEGHLKGLMLGEYCLAYYIYISNGKKVLSYLSKQTKAKESPLQTCTFPILPLLSCPWITCIQAYFRFLTDKKNQLTKIPHTTLLGMACICIYICLDTALHTNIHIVINSEIVITASWDHSAIGHKTHNDEIRTLICLCKKKKKKNIQAFFPV